MCDINHCVTFQASFERDSDGFWVAHIEQTGGPSDGCRVSAPVTVRHTLPVPPSATHEQAQEAFFELLEREMSREVGRRGFRQLHPTS